MNKDIFQILQKVWGYTAFRPLQEEIINSVLEGNDTLTLLPTGGGKSLCYQVPGLAKEGICLVVSPLISLMKDQVDMLLSKNIKASCIHSGMTYREVELAMDNAMYGGQKFLYVSPERLKTDLFKARLPSMNINLIAVDEAHCISQWGYDFRPAYLDIAEIREFFPKVPVLALTATATEVVKNDIKAKLLFNKNSNTFTESFDRKNLIYASLETEDLKKKTTELVRRISGTGIIYCRNRRSTKEIALHLQKNGEKADFYHAGLTHSERVKKQNAWMNNQSRIIVSTNAFGMGIDKSDVRFVIHYDLPESLEAYYQEAGRAGRDGKKSFAICLVNKPSRLEMEKNFNEHKVDFKEISNLYHALGNYYQLPIGSGAFQTFPFNISDFCARFEYKPTKAFQILKILESVGYLAFNESAFNPSRLMITVPYNELYEFEVKNPTLALLIRTILRSYGGCFEDFVQIFEEQIASRLEISTAEVIKSLTSLSNNKILEYIPKKNGPELYWLVPRVPKEDLIIDSKGLKLRLENQRKRMESILDYAFEKQRCRSQILLGYFGEKLTQRCNHCDYCLKYSKDEIRSDKFELLKLEITKKLRSKSLDISALRDSLKESDETLFLEVIRWLADKQFIKVEGTIASGK